MVTVTPEGRDVIHERRPARLLLPPSDSGVSLTGGGTKPKGSKASRRAKVLAVRTEETRPSPGLGIPIVVDHAGELDETGRALFDALRAFRLEEARQAGVPPYVIASDRTLRDIALLRPRSLEELKLAHGIGPSKCERYGAAILEVIAAAGR